ncbi:MAG: sulfite exporter TauE/SafE family protein [Acidobacteriota bacterium]|nr:sulfite exporter TauE/SafE family protein [Acidobacteriota bacterium]MDE3030066.1 sulfite exporter TauE/SafE family protein [Acidobacteriota bacterium]MDE3092576.1 sulfite exporter TauE/SafE family protein [Acidobacteriota bacterium]MDE3139711.1 sulfite exporter TauE/SafE family protein [Acidobacteriota bacterium]MDE3146951.1 sulfite exporter TauE/SafE family protein [Acidobacteriota bacterium]
MFATTLSLSWRTVLVLLAGLAGGVANGIAGGGSFVVFPTLLALGVAPLAANVSTTVGVTPSYAGGIHRFRAQIRPHRRLLVALVPSCAVGAGVGCALLLAFPATTFRLIVPWLVAVGTLLFALAPMITRRLAHIDHSHPARRWFLHAGVFAIAIYGGYFGAGLGILLLAVMAISLPFEMAELQGLRYVLSTIINLAAAAVFILRGHLVGYAVGALLVGTLMGGWVGGWMVQRLSTRAVRLLIVSIGVATTIHLA